MRYAARDHAPRTRTGTRPIAVATDEGALRAMIYRGTERAARDADVAAMSAPCHGLRAQRPMSTRSGLDR